MSDEEVNNSSSSESAERLDSSATGGEQEVSPAPLAQKTFYEAALATKLAAENENHQTTLLAHNIQSATAVVPTNESVNPASEANDPTQNSSPPRQKHKCLIVSIVVALAISIAIAVPLAVSNSTRDGVDEAKKYTNAGTPPEFTSVKDPEREAAIADKIVLVTPGGNETLMDSNSPHYRSWQWLVYDDELQLDPAAGNLQQRYLLMTIYFPTTTYESDRPQQWGSAVHECEWNGVQCTDKQALGNKYGHAGTVEIETAQNIVTGIDLRQRLSGQIPRDLSSFPFLQYLNLENNRLVGSLPSHIYQLHNLKTLILSQNELSDVDLIGGFQHLEHLHLSMNNLKGSLPSSFQNLKNLKTLNLHSNEFTGDLFEVIRDFESLETIDVAFNDFIGTLPPSIGNMTNLTTILLGNNQISGSIPEEILLCTKLQDFSVEANYDMGGMIPTGLGLLTSLAYLNLSTCGFRGPLPSSLGDLKELKFMDVSFNSLEGVLPKELGNATNLTKLVLAHNEFDGTLPDEFGMLVNLQELYLQTNNIVGTMPEGMCTLRKEGALKSLTASCDIACTCCDGRYCM